MGCDKAVDMNNSLWENATQSGLHWCRHEIDK